MPLSGPTLAEAVRKKMGFPLPLSLPLIGEATGIIGHIQSMGKATKGGIPGPHKILGLNGPAMALMVATASGFPGVSKELLILYQSMCKYIMSNAEVFYKGAPPPAEPSWTIGGTISGLDGPKMAQQISKDLGKDEASKELIAKCSAIVEHLQKSGQVVDGTIS